MSSDRAAVAREREPRNTAVGVWMRMLACGNIVQAHLRERLREEYGTTLARFDVLAQIDRPPRGPTMSELSARLMVTKGNITDLIGRLEADDLVTRKRCERDQRIQYVHLTPRGKRLIDAMTASHAKWLAELMGELGSDEIAQFYDMFGRLKAVLRPAPRQSAAAKSESRGM